eukprot:Seg3687.3 transcript_id=Seg3687.3/GoldUCD/mRNA.D3Y31 product="hypothetical protein" protein_id=Seg3687.3/GoldUCD/D3Y31
MMNKLEVLAAVMQQHEAQLRQRNNELENNNICNVNGNRQKFDDTARYHEQIFRSGTGDNLQINTNENENAEYNSLCGKEDVHACSEENDLSILNFSWNKTQGEASMEVNKHSELDYEHSCFRVEESIDSQIENEVRSKGYFRKLRPRSKKLTNLHNQGNIIEENSLKNMTAENYDRIEPGPLLEENIEMAEPSREIVSLISESNFENDENTSERNCKYYKPNTLTRISPFLEPDKYEAEPDIIDAKADVKTNVIPNNKIEAKSNVGTCMRLDNVKPDVQKDTEPDAKPELRTKMKPEVKPEVRTDMRPEVKPEVRTDMKPELSLDEISKSKDWEIAETRNGKYFLDFKSPYFTMNERIRILEVALEDIRERYIEVKEEYQNFNRKCTRWRRKRRNNGSI